MASQSAVPDIVDDSRPQILLLSLDFESYQDQIYDSLWTKLSNQARVQRSKQAAPTIRYLTTNNPTAILITDAGIMDPANIDVVKALKAYISNGGTAILCCSCSSFMNPSKADRFFTTHFSLPWKFGNYERTDVYLREEVAVRHLPLGRKGLEHLPRSYSQKAVFLKNVSEEGIIYSPREDSMTQSRVFAPRAADTEQTPVAWVGIEKGWLGYVGDVNGEEGSDSVILAMCGLSASG
ncbi:hypothetical protein D6D04_01652 [Aureobasidium pullulans]|nr:hypothetical protein D6D04_01652 [Aureobasidium pullulans]